MLAIVVIIGFFSILPNSCGHCDTSNLKYKWVSIDLFNLKVVSTVGSKIYYKLIDTTYYQYDKFGIQISINGTTLAKNYFNPVSLTQTCNAQIFDCFKDYHTENPISDIRIITLSDFDDSHLKNADISDYFMASLQDYELSSITDYLSDNYEINGSHRDLTNSFSRDINLFLRIRPTIDSIFKFNVNVILMDNSEMCKMTGEIKIK